MPTYVRVHTSRVSEPCRFDAAPTPEPYIFFTTPEPASFMGQLTADSHHCIGILGKNLRRCVSNYTLYKYIGRYR